MRKLITAGMAAASLAASLLVGSGAAQADDNGKNDGPQCSYTEICFREFAGSDQAVKQFWYSANHERVAGVHDYYRWWLPASGTRGSYVMDGAEEFKNRDSSCTVYIWNIDSRGNWFKFAHQPANSSSWFFSLYRTNNGHSRCSEGAPVNK